MCKAFVFLPTYVFLICFTKLLLYQTKLIFTHFLLIFKIQYHEYQTLESNCTPVQQKSSSTHIRPEFYILYPRSMCTRPACRVILYLHEQTQYSLFLMFLHFIILYINIMQYSLFNTTLV